jgi:transcriptional regulator with XRE-family HTH domain
MTELSIFLKKQMKDNEWTWREFEETTGVSKSALANIIDNPNVIPSLETLSKVSRAFNIPLWRVVEMAGYDLDLDTTDPDHTKRLSKLMEVMPQYQPVLEHLQKLDKEDIDGVLAYLEVLARRRATT